MQYSQSYRYLARAVNRVGSYASQRQVAKPFSRPGFTIVELLIVIVVIGILAAITIVAYNGVQDRSKNSATISAATQVKKLMDIYVTQNGQEVSTTTSICLSEDNACLTSATGSAVTADNTALLATLRTAGSVPASMPWPSGLRYAYGATRTADGAPNPAMIIYYLKGTAVNCGPNVLTGDSPGYTWSTTGYTSSSGGWTLCYLPIKYSGSL